MSRRPAVISQADLTRTLRALADAGLRVARVIARADGIVIEAVPAGAVDSKDIVTIVTPEPTGADIVL